MERSVLEQEVERDKSSHSLLRERSPEEEVSQRAGEVNLDGRGHESCDPVRHEQSIPLGHL